MKRSCFALLILAAILSCCIDEDTKDCPPNNNLTLKLSYLDNDSENLFSQLIGKTCLFIFNEQGYFVQKKTINTASLEGDCSVSLSLPPGVYRFVLWGNLLDKTDVCSLSSSTHIDKSFIYNTTLQEGSAVNSDKLYYSAGSQEDNASDFYFTVPRFNAITKTMDFTCAYINIQVFAEGFIDQNEAGKNLPPLVEIEALETKIDFNMHPFDPTSYYTQQTVFQNIQGTELAAAYFYLPRFKNENSLKLRLRKASDGTILATVKLKDYMSKHNLTIENTQKATIPLYISYDDSQKIGVVITLPKWGELPVNPEL